MLGKQSKIVFFTKVQRTPKLVLAGSELHLWTLICQHSFIYVSRNVWKTFRSRLFHEGTADPKTCFEWFWATSLNIDLPTFFHLCLKKCLKKRPKQSFSRTYSAPKTRFDWFWATSVHIDLATFFHLCLKKCLKNLPKQSFWRRYIGYQNVFWLILSYISRNNV